MTDAQPPGGHDGPSERPNEKGDATGGVGIGLAIYAVLQLTLGSFAALYGMTGYDQGSQTMLGLYALLGLVAVGYGGLLCTSKTYRTKGIGLGMIIGWSALSIGTLGMCTGLNPNLYQ